MAMEIRVGQLFNSYEEVSVFLDEYQRETEQQYSIKNSKRIDIVCKKKDYNPRLVYDEIYYKCTKAGVYVPKGKNIRSRVSGKTNCPACITFRATSSKQELRVTNANLQHNHGPNPPPLRPKQTRLLNVKSAAAVAHNDTPKEMDHLEPKSVESVGTDEELVVEPSTKTSSAGSSSACSLPDTSNPPPLRLKQTRLLNVESAAAVAHNDTPKEMDHLKPKSVESLGTDEELVVEPSTKTSSAGRSSAVRSSACSLSDTSLFVDNGSPASTTTKEATEITNTFEDISINSSTSNLSEPSESLTSEKYKEMENNHETHVGDDMKLLEESEQHSDENSASINLGVSKNSGSNAETTDIARASGLAEPIAEAVDVKNIVLPQKVSRGRPKGRVLKAIGLPKKSNKAIAFAEKSVYRKKKQILRWFVPRENIEICLNGEFKIGLAEVSNVKASGLCDATASDVVDFVLVQPYFTPEAFKKLKRIISQKKKNGLLSCAICKQPLSDNGIECDCCLLWHDFECVGISRAPKSSSTWFCPGCLAK